MFEALHNQLAVYPNVIYIEAFLATFLHAVRSDSAGESLLVDRLQDLSHDAAGTVLIAARDPAAAALVATTEWVAGTPSAAGGGIPVANVFTDEGIWAILDSGCNTTCHGEVWAQNAERMLANGVRDEVGRRAWQELRWPHSVVAPRVERRHASPRACEVWMDRGLRFKRPFCAPVFSVHPL